MAIDEAEVLRIARLAHLEYPTGEGTLFDAATLARLAADMGKFLDHVKALEALDVSNVAPTSHGVPLPTSYAADEPQPHLAVDAALSGAPARVGDAFSVPKIVE